MEQMESHFKMKTNQPLLVILPQSALEKLCRPILRYYSKRACRTYDFIL